VEENMDLEEDVEDKEEQRGAAEHGKQRGAAECGGEEKEKKRSAAQAGGDEKEKEDEEGDEEGQEKSEERGGGGGEQEEEEREDTFWSDAKYLMFAACLLPEFGSKMGPRNCFDVQVPSFWVATLSEEDKAILRKAADAFFWEIPRDPALHGKSKRGRLESTQVRATRMKKTDDIRAAWQELFSRRRAEQPKDTEPIKDEDVRAKIWNRWCNDWIADNLTLAQRRGTRSQQTSIFNVYMHRTYGHRCFVFAMLEMGITWIPAGGVREGLGSRVSGLWSLVSGLWSLVAPRWCARGREGWEPAVKVTAGGT